MSGGGTVSNPCLVTSWTTLDAVRNGLTSNYALDNNLSASTGDYSGLGDTWIPIGDYYSPPDSTFTGSFDGRGHAVSNLIVDTNGNDYGGLFGVVGTGGTVYNINVDAASVTGASDVGGLAGYVEGGIINNSFSNGDISGNGEVGGLVGYAVYSTIDNSYATGTVSGGSGNEVGGLVGGMGTSSVFNSHATATVVTSGDYVSGLVGYVYGASTVDNSYSIADVNGHNSVGGLVGETYNIQH